VPASSRPDVPPASIDPAGDPEGAAIRTVRTPGTRLEYRGGPWDDRVDHVADASHRLPDHVDPDGVDVPGTYELAQVADGVGYYDWRPARPATTSRR